MQVIRENIAAAKARLSELVNAALDGREVLLCKDGQPVVRLVPTVAVAEADDPCRLIDDLVVRASPDEFSAPLLPEEWGELSVSTTTKKRTRKSKQKKK